MKRWLLAAILALSPIVANAQSYRDAEGTVVPGYVLLAGCSPNGFCLGPVGANNPFPIAQSGSIGADHSANQPTLPNIGANFGPTGTYAGYVLIATVAANASRLNIDVENTSGAQIVVVRDDGTAASGSAPNNASVFALAGGSGPGAQGAAWSSQTFKGRLQIYAASSTAQVAVMGD